VPELQVPEQQVSELQVSELQVSELQVSVQQVQERQVQERQVQERQAHRQQEAQVPRRVQTPRPPRAQQAVHLPPPIGQAAQRHPAQPASQGRATARAARGQGVAQQVNRATQVNRA